MYEPTHEQREALGILNCDNSGIYEHPDRDDRIRVGSERARSVYLNHESGKPFRVLVVAPSANHEQWRETMIDSLDAAEKDVQHIRSHKVSKFWWDTHLLNHEASEVSIISWENMRGQVPRNMKRSLTPTQKEIIGAMGVGTVPPWRATGAWDLVIADDSDRMAFRSTLQASVMKMIWSHNKLALSGRAEGSHPEGLWSTLNWLWKDDFKAFWAWAEARFEMESVRMGHSIQFTEIGQELHPGARWEGVPCAVRR